jgi:hypothetical protein
VSGARAWQHAAAGHRAGDQEGAGLDAVGQHVVAAAVQALDAVDGDGVGAGALRSCAPIAFRQLARSTTSGSCAAFSMTVVPSASAAAIMMFSVPVTVTMSNHDAGAAQALGAGRM